MTNKVKIEITYSWEVSQKEWVEGKEFWIKDLEDKASYDAIDVFHHLRQIKNPESKVKVTKL
jgi:hypothetical protein